MEISNGPPANMAPVAGEGALKKTSEPVEMVRAPVVQAAALKFAAEKVGYVLVLAPVLRTTKEPPKRVEKVTEIAGPV